MNDQSTNHHTPLCCTTSDGDAACVCTDNTDATLAQLAKALGHPARVAILRLLLARQECICGEICTEIPLAQSTISQHLKVLKEADLIQGEVDGPRICYCVNRTTLTQLQTLIAAFS